jgi:hypothetical protein
MAAPYKANTVGSWHPPRIRKERTMSRTQKRYRLATNDNETVVRK